MQEESGRVWFVYDQKVVTGPLTDEGVRELIVQGHLRKTDLLWRRGLKEWTKTEDWLAATPQSEPLTTPEGTSSKEYRDDTATNDEETGKPAASTSVTGTDPASDVWY